MNASDQLKLPVSLPPHKVLKQVAIRSEVVNYNHQMINVPWMWKETMGKGASVLILDTGRPKHMDINPGVYRSFVGNHDDGFDRQGHSTHCGGIVHATANNGMGVAGIAPEATVSYGKVLGDDGSGTIESIINGIKWGIELEVDIISMSLGISEPAPTIEVLREACDLANEAGIAIFAAAGNESGTVGQPAQYPSCISIAAVDEQKRHAPFSNIGPENDFAFGGVAVYSTYLNNSYVKLSGTSMACPVAAGVGALIIAKHGLDNEVLSPFELKEHMAKIAEDVGPEGHDGIFGAGIPMFGRIAEPAPDPDEPDGGDGSLCTRLLPRIARQLADEAEDGKSMPEILRAAADDLERILGRL